MSFCKFSSQINSNNITIVENAFIEEHLPFASGEQVRIYLFGLYLCYNENVLKNELSTLESFASDLGISPDDVLSAFKFWQEQGLVQIVETNPLQVQYLPVKNAVVKQKFKPNKFAQFNLQIQQIISGRMITPNEFSEYYALLENYNMLPEALLMIAQYCTQTKGNNVGYAYILTVAKNWANEGILSFQQVEQRLQEFSATELALKDVFKALKISRKPTFEDKQQYLKWTKNMDFSPEVVLYVAKNLKKPFFEKLAQKLGKYYELHLMSVSEIEDYETKKNELIALAKDINKTLGTYYEDLENVIETFISQWLMHGFSEDSLKLVANYCFKKAIKSLPGMDAVIQKLYQNGLTSVEGIAQHLANIKAQDEQIKQILEKAGSYRNVIDFDRDCYKTWVDIWHMPQELIDYAATLSAGKANPMPYMNRILSNWTQQKIFTLEEAQLSGNIFKAGIGEENSKDKMHSRTYTSDELNSLVSDVIDIEI